MTPPSQIYSLKEYMSLVPHGTTPGWYCLSPMGHVLAVQRPSLSASYLIHQQEREGPTCLVNVMFFTQKNLPPRGFPSSEGAGLGGSTGHHPVGAAGTPAQLKRVLGGGMQVIPRAGQSTMSSVPSATSQLSQGSVWRRKRI